MGDVQVDRLGDIFLDLVHGLTRESIDQIDGNIVKSCLLEVADIVIDILLLVTPTDLFQHLVVKGLDTQRDPIDLRVLENCDLIRIQISRICLDGKLFYLR